MRQRCNNPNCVTYPRYGGRGITVCDRWNCFENFVEDIGVRPSLKHSIDRLNNDLGYCKENCRWATFSEQARNTRKAIFIEGKPLAQIAEEQNLSYGYVYKQMIWNGKPVEFFEDIRKNKDHWKIIEMHAKKLGITPCALADRLRNGWSWEDAISKTRQTSPRPKTELQKQIREASIVLNISRAAIRNRIKAGWDIEKALTTPNKHNS
jgi:hypothetical protein